MLSETIEAGKRAGTVKGNDLKRVAVDTTVMEKNITHPTDARLYETARRKLVGLAREAGISLRQNYNRLGARLVGQVGRYAHARQFKRMRKALRTLKGYTGRVLRDVERQLGKVPEGALRTQIEQMIALVNRLLAQKPNDKKKLYSLTACMSRRWIAYRKARRTSVTSSGPRSAWPQPTEAASWSGCGRCQVIPTTVIR